jgi:enoyl-CoA hydratase
MKDQMPNEFASEWTAFKTSIADDGIARLQFNQPAKANAMTRAFWKEFPIAISALRHNRNARVLIISGEGKHFCAGMDLSIFSSSQSLDNGQARQRERLRQIIIELQNTFTGLEQLRVPVIAAIQGACIGAGLDLAAACDMRFASSSAYFCIQEINLAMMADLGVLQRLPKLVPQGIARELAFTGDRMLADRALQFGLVNAVFESDDDLHASVTQLAGRIAAKSPLAIAATKESMLFASNNSTQDALAHAAILQSSVLDVEDLTKAAQAQARKEVPEFAPLLNSETI